MLRGESLSRMVSSRAQSRSRTCRWAIATNPGQTCPPPRSAAHGIVRCCAQRMLTAVSYFTACFAPASIISSL